MRKPVSFVKPLINQGKCTHKEMKCLIISLLDYPLMGRSAAAILMCGSVCVYRLHDGIIWGIIKKRLPDR